MIYQKNIYPILLLLLFVLVGCESENNNTITITNAKNPYAVSVSNTKNDFKDYWYQGKAEITSYDLEQSRYGEIHEGSAVLVFVTEDFSKKKHVKLDNPSAKPSDAIPVLKLNLTRKFNTGVYPYSIMQSTFTPIDVKKHPHTLKVTQSSQEWCGHTFTQLNLGKKGYESQLFSYFETEGDTKTMLKKTWLEDEIWSKIRIAPDQLPQGDFEIIPSMTFARLRHVSLKNEQATASLVEKGNEMQYNLQYKNLERKLSINFDKSFPHQIISWEETNKSGFGSSAKSLTTKAVRKKSLLLDYWSKNDQADSHYRKELGLD